MKNDLHRLRIARIASRPLLAAALAALLGALPLGAQPIPIPSSSGAPNQGAVLPSPVVPATPAPQGDASTLIQTPSAIPRTQAAGSAKLAAAAPREETMRLPIRKLIGLTDSILMKTPSSYYTLFVPQSARFQLKSYNLHLEFTNSIALLTERSVIRVVVNDTIVAQYYLNRDKPFNVVDIAIPLNVLKIGFNRLQFVVAQHYTYKCEDPAAPELFTEINPDTSYLSATGDWKNVPERLSYLRWWLDEKLWIPYQYNICIPGASQFSDLHLSWGALIAGGIGLALNNQPFRIATATALRPGMDNIVIGTASDLSGFLTSSEIGTVNGSFLAIKALPGDPTHCMIILSGRNEAEVSQAAFAFGLVNIPLPDSQYVVVSQLALSDKSAYIRNAPVNVPGIYSFRELGYRTRTVKGWNTGGFELPIYMPGDISKDDGSNVELRLHFAYGAALRKDSVFNLLVNNQFQTAIRLSDPNGSMHVDHRVYLPITAFQPGLNTVELTPVMVPMVSSDCEIVQEENLRFTLYEDSDFVLPHALHKARLPDFGNFSQTTFPYSSAPDGSESAVFVTSRDPDTICAAWTLLGKMAQISGALPAQLEIGFQAPVSRTAKSLLVVGPRDQIPDSIVASAPVSPLKVGKMRYLVSVSPKPERLAASPIEEFIEKVRGIPAERAEPEPPATANLSTISDLVDDTVAVQFESKEFQGYPTTIFTAIDSGRLLAGMNMLQDRRIWDGLSGDLAVWNTNPDSLAIAKVGPDFIFKARGPVTRIATGLDRQPWLFAVILVVVLLLLALAVRAILRRREIPSNTLDDKE